MNKKRLQRLGVVCMAAAMVLTTVSFPRVAKAEGKRQRRQMRQRVLNRKQAKF